MFDISGLWIGFFKVAWNIIGRDISDVALEFFYSFKLLKEINATIITSVGNPIYASGFRPIASGNTMYNCISKCFVRGTKCASYCCS